jgi:hypothetical protein
MVGLTFFNHRSPSMMSSGPRSVTRKSVDSFYEPIVSVRRVKCVSNPALFLELSMLCKAMVFGNGKQRI